MLKSLLLAGLFAGFQNPPNDSKPWAYWWWINGHVDRRTITDDLEWMKRLGFGGLLMFDSRGYWDDDDHIVNPRPKFEFMSPEWQEHVEFAVREAARLGLKFTMNMSSSGGKLDGPWCVGGEAPKRLVYRFEATSSPAVADAIEAEGLRYYHDIDVQDVWYDGETIAADGKWHDGGEGLFLQGFVASGQVADESVRMRRRVSPGTPGAKKIRVRFGQAVLPGHDRDVDVLDKAAVTAHFNRFQGVLQARFPELVGRDRTLSALYSVSWEGSMPTWTGEFEREFRKSAGFEVKPCLPYLAGFTDSGRENFIKAYRLARNDMFRENFYGTMRDLAHAHGLDWYSESGGPWDRAPHLFQEADQLRFLSVNDFPQGEFWPVEENRRTSASGLENANGRFHLHGAVSCAHIYDKRIVSAEAFTQMHRHWSVDPAFLKPLGDIAFADGVNRLVWHTFTCSPAEFGVPGAEYFAGSHINRNVTWSKDAAPFITYIGRCQYLLQMGEPVTDIAILGGNRTYQGRWGRFRDRVSDVSVEPDLDAVIPAGFAYDLVNDDALARMPGLLERYQVVFDLRKDENRGKAVPVGDLIPDVQSDSPDITWCHRRVKDVADIYFLTGAGNLAGRNGRVVFRSRASRVEVWEPITGRRSPARNVYARGAAQTELSLDLPQGGSVFVMFLKDAKIGAEELRVARATNPLFAEDWSKVAIGTEWELSFSYPDGISAEPPAAFAVSRLFDFASRPETRYFSGTTTYRCRFRVSGKESSSGTWLSLGELKTGLARVLLNGRDCGVAWCRPWAVDVTEAVKDGENELEIRYTNNWCNRLVGDCRLPEKSRVTRSTIHYWTVERRPIGADHSQGVRPTLYSGYSAYDSLQPSGLTGPVKILRGN